jgi:hypothetical protein
MRDFPRPRCTMFGVPGPGCPPPQHDTQTGSEDVQHKHHIAGRCPDSQSRQPGVGYSIRLLTAALPKWELAAAMGGAGLALRADDGGLL